VKNQISAGLTSSQGMKREMGRQNDSRNSQDGLDDARGTSGTREQIDVIIRKNSSK
jgi:hypothetical protein